MIEDISIVHSWSFLLKKWWRPVALWSSPVKHQTWGLVRSHGHGNLRNVAISSFAGKQKDLLKRRACPTSQNKPASRGSQSTLCYSGQPRSKWLILNVTSDGSCVSDGSVTNMLCPVWQTDCSNTHQRRAAQHILISACRSFMFWRGPFSPHLRLSSARVTLVLNLVLQ